MTRFRTPRASQAQPAPSALATVWLCAVVLACGCEERMPTPRIYTVSPQRTHSDRPQRLTITGQDLVPRYHIDVPAGQRHADASGFDGLVGKPPAAAALRDFEFLTDGLLAATLDAGLPAGTHDVVVIDPRGARAVLAGAYVSLGPDGIPPVVGISSPGPSTLLAPGTPVAARVVVDEEGGLRRVGWEGHSPGSAMVSGECPLAMNPTMPTPSTTMTTAGPGRLVCDFSFVVPRGLLPGDTFIISVTAIDGAPIGNVGASSRTFLLQAPPVLSSVSPSRGGAAGGTDLVVRGGGFLPGSIVLFGETPLEPDGGILLDAHTIIGKAPPHPAGPTVVRVQGPLGETGEDDVFEYLAPPQLLALEPPGGPAAGGQSVRVRGQNFTPATRVFFGPTLATAVPLGNALFVDHSEIRGNAPPGHGPVTVHVIDPVAGWSAQPAAFAWEAEP